MRFTNTAVPRFDGGGCWQQHLQIVQAIVKSNGWMDGMAALQLFAHLDGEALNVALLMPEELPRETNCMLTEIRERDSPTVNGSGDVCQRTGNPCSAGIRRPGQACPGLGDQGQIY